MEKKTAQPGSGCMKHTVYMEDRLHTSITGITDVCSFHETEVILKVGDATMIVTGSEFHVEKLMIEEGKLLIDGRVDSVVYETERASSARQIFARWRK